MWQGNSTIAEQYSLHTLYGTLIGFNTPQTTTAATTQYWRQPSLTWWSNEEPQRCIACTAHALVHTICKLVNVSYYKSRVVTNKFLMYRKGGVRRHHHTPTVRPGKGSTVTVAHHGWGIGCKEWILGEEHWIVQRGESNATYRGQWGQRTDVPCETHVSERHQTQSK